MATCCFFGHKDTPSDIKPQLTDVLTKLREQSQFDTFYVGNQGHFDSMVYSLLQEFSEQYPTIHYYIVLSYIPQNKNLDYDPSCTLIPAGIEKVPKRFAISWRNKWMVKQADYVVSYVIHSWGGAAQFTEFAEKQNKQVIKLSL